MKPTAVPQSVVAIACATGALLAASDVAGQFTNASSTWLGGVSVGARSASMADIDGDGDLDLFFQRFSSGRTNRLFRNNIVGLGTSNFTNVSTSLLPTGLTDSWSSAWGDYDGDGRIDVFIGETNSSSNTGTVLRNTPSGFVNTSVGTGLDDPGFHQSVAWSDIDNDRDLDLILAMEGPEQHEVYLHGPGHVFEQSGAAVGLQVPFGTKAYGLAIGDTDGDGDRDVYISTCRAGGNIRKNFFENRLIHNGVNTGVLSFVDIAGDSPTDPNGNGTQFMENGYGSEFHDFDDDGDLDLLMTGADAQPSKIFRNIGGNKFNEAVSILGEPGKRPDVDLNGSRAVDYDNDGDLDLFFHDNSPNMSPGNGNARKLYRNNGNWQFEDVTLALGLDDTVQGGYDSVWGDIDLDGDQDLIAPAVNTTERVFINNTINGATTNGNHWLYLRLAGPADNTTGVGASVYATINQGTPQERTLRREANSNAGAFNQSDVPVHFGLGAATEIDLLRIVWPDDTQQVLEDVAVDRYITVNISGDFDGDGKVDSLDYAQWRGDFGQNDDSDFNLDGKSDGRDFLAWQRGYANGMAFLNPATPVPEPAGALPLAVALAAVLRLRRR